MYDTIVVGTDGSGTAAVAVARAAELAAGSKARVVIVSAYQPVGEERLRSERKDAPEDLAWMINPREEVDNVLVSAKRECAARGVARVDIRAEESTPADALLDVAAEVGAGLVVVGNVGMSGARRFLMGSVPNRVAHHAPCDVLIVRTADAGRP